MKQLFRGAVWEWDVLISDGRLVTSQVKAGPQWQELRNSDLMRLQLNTARNGAAFKNQTQKCV